EASGAVLWRDGKSQITHVDGAKGTKYDIVRNDKNMVSEVRITAPAGKGPSETLTSTDGKNWTRKFTQNGQTRVEQFEGAVSVSPEGVITERKKNGSTRTLRPEGSTVSFDAAANTASVSRPDGSSLKIAGFGPDGKPNKIVKDDGSYSATNDGVTWSDYDPSGKQVGAERKETVNFNRSNGTLDVAAVDGTRRELTGGDGTYSKQEKNAAGQILMTESKNERGEVTKTRFDKGEKVDTTINYPNGTYRSYDNNNLLKEFKDVNGRVTKLEWQSEGGNTVVKSYTDEKGVKWNRQTEHGRAFYQKEGAHNRRNESVFVNPEGNLERIYSVSSDLVGTNVGETQVTMRETRGMDGNIVSTYDKNGGMTIRNSDGLLSRSIRADGTVTQFGYNGTDRYGLPILRTVVEGEGPSAKTWSLSGDKEWTSGAERQIAFWRVDQITGDMTYFNGDSLGRQRYSLESGWSKPPWGGEDLQGKANGIKDVKDNTWILNYSMPWQDSRFDDLNRRFQGLSGEEMQMMKYHLSAHKGIDIGQYVTDKWGDTGYEGVTLHGHLAREGYTRTVDYAEKADVTMRGALAEMAANSGGRRHSEIQKDIRDKVGILNQEQLDTLNQISKANATDGKTSLERMKEHPSWKNAPEVHKAAMELYLAKGKEARSPQEEAHLMKLALEYKSRYSGGRGGQVAPHLQRLELFKEFSGEARTSQASRDYFRTDMGGDALLEKALVRPGATQRDADGKPGAYEYHNSMWKGNDDAGRLMTQAREFMKDGHLTAATMLEEGNWGSGTSTEEVKQIFEKMTDADRVKVREGLDIRMALEGKFGDDAKIKAEALRDDKGEKGKKANESLEYFDKLNRTCSNLAIFADERRRVEYIARAAGASFTHEMGEGNVSTMWFRNADKQEHMKAVETIDRESFDLLSSDKAMRSLNDQFMTDHFESYERGKAASDLLRNKFDYADGLLGKSPNEIKSLLAGTRDLTQAQFDTLLQSRELDPKIVAGQALQNQIDRGGMIAQRIANGEKVAAAIDKGERKVEGLPFQDKLAFDQFQAHRGEQLQAQISAGTKTVDKLTPLEKQALDTYNSVKDTAPFKTDKEALKQFDIATGEQLARGPAAPAPTEAAKRALDAFEQVKETKEFKDSRVALDAFKKFQESGALVQDIKDGQKLDRNIDEGRLINDSLKGLEGALRDAAIAKLSPDKKEQLSQFQASESGTLSDHNKALLKQFHAWQRTEAKELGTEVDRGKALADKIAAEPPDKRSGFRNALPEGDRQALKAYEQMKSGQDLLADINKGRVLSPKIGEGGPSKEQTQAIELGRSLATQLNKLPESERHKKEGELKPEEKARLDLYRESLYRQHQNGVLPADQMLLVTKAEALAMAAGEPEPKGELLSDSVRQSLKLHENTTAYRADATGLKAFLDGQQLALQFKDMRTSERDSQIAEMKKNGEGSARLAALDAYRGTAYDLTQANVRRGLEEALKDSVHTFSTDRGAMFDAMVNMKPDERKRYATDETYRNSIDKLVAETLKSSPSGQKAAEHLLAQIARDPSRAPEKDVVFELYSKAAEMGHSTSATVSLLQDAFNGPQADALRRKLDPNDKVNYEPAFAKAFDDAVKAGFPIPTDGENHPIYQKAEWDAKVQKEFVDPIVKDGHVSLSTMRGLYFSQKDMAKEILKLNESSLRHLKATDGDALDKTFSDGYWSGDVKQFMEKVLDQGKVNTEDRLRALHLGILPRDELRKVLGEIKTQPQRNDVLDRYAQKYGGTASEDIRKVAAPKDYARVELALTHRELDQMEVVDIVRAQVKRTDSSGANFGWDSSRVQMMDSMGRLEKTMATANVNYERANDMEIQRLTGNVFDGVDANVAAYKAQADLITDSVIMAAAAAATVLTGGAASPLLIAAFVAGGAAFKMTANAAILGKNYDTHDAVDDAIKGAINGASIAGPAELLAIAKIGGAAATTTATKIMTHAAFDALDDVAKAAVKKAIEKEIRVGLQQVVLSNVTKNVDDQIIGNVLKAIGSKVPAEQQMLLRAAMKESMQEAVMKEGTKWMRNEVTSAMATVVSGAAQANISTTAELFMSGDLTIAKIMNGSAFNSNVLDRYLTSNVHSLVGGLGGQGAGLLSRRVTGQEQMAALLGKATKTPVDQLSQNMHRLATVGHLSASSLWMTGSMAAGNMLSNNIVENMMHGKAWNGEGFNQNLLNSAWAPFFQ
nr:hypothetical protein [Candidatus Melainabacteria bacterium]